MRGKQIVSALALLFVSASARGQEKLNIIPLPAAISQQPGYFTLSPQTHLKVNSFTPEINILQDMVKGYTGHTLPAEGKGNVVFIDLHPGTDVEGYELSVTKDSIRISANEPAGVFYALQTLQQVCFSGKKTGDDAYQVPAVKIKDTPAYKWRGLMIDVSRHFFTIEYLKKQIDLLSFYKMNKLHLHLTDDQGWRIEIKRYPALTQVGAWRSLNEQDSTCIQQSAKDPDFALDNRFILNIKGDTLYGGYYTQESLKDLVAYAATKHVEIIPEIDMPGHMSAAIRAYPELSCTGNVGWGKTFSTPICPCKDTVFAFLQDIIDEVTTIFPSSYIHLGVDEVEKNTWETSDACKALMQEKGYKEVAQLQTYFAERLQAYVTSKGKQLIAWDDVLEGGINKEVNIMYWRDWVGGVPEAVAKNGNTIIFTPGGELYFNRPDSALRPIYTKVPAAMNAMPHQLVMGAQANIWTERIPSENRTNYLLYPRLLALSEITWTPTGKLDFESFKQRLEPQFSYLDKQGVKHALLTYALTPVYKTEKALNISFETEQVNPAIYYTLDGTQPTAQSRRYTAAGISIADSAVVSAAIIKDGQVLQPVYRQHLDFHKAIGKKVVYNASYDTAYPAHREATFTDGKRGGSSYADGNWQGFTRDMNVTIDMGKEVSLSYFAADFMQEKGPGVYFPTAVIIRTSADGKTFKDALTIKKEIAENGIQTFSGKLKNSEKVRYINVVAKVKTGFIFTDEIVVY